MNNTNPSQHTPPGVQRLLKVDEVACSLNISRSYAYHLLETGEIPCVCIGKSRRVRPQDLAEYIDKNLRSQADYK